MANTNDKTALLVMDVQPGIVDLVAAPSHRHDFGSMAEESSVKDD